MRFLNAGVASIALLWAGQAFAQEASEASSAGDDIIVTAQKRSERLVDVPVSISSVSGENLAVAGQDSLLSLNKLVPGLYITQPVYFLSPTVRGVGSTLSVTNESAVAVYIDGVYQPAQASNVFDLASISGVEVLKGPQGTLFGRNATGGAILVKTLDPSFNREGRFNLSYSRFNEVRANAYVNFPLGDAVAANVAASYRYSGGYIRDVRTGDIVNEAKSFAIRSKLLIQPSDNLDVILTAAHTQYSDPTASNYQSLNGQNALTANPLAGPLARGRFEVSHNTRDVLRISAQEFTGRVNLDTGVGTLSSITAYKLDKLETTNDVDNTYLPNFSVDFVFKQRTFSQEFNFTSPAGDNFSYVIGAYYYHNYKYYPFYQYSGFDFLEQANWADSLAGYADGTYEFGKLAVIGGIRYSTEKRKIANALLPPLNPIVGSVKRETRDSAWTPRFGLRYALGARTNIYATYSRGFKTGAFNGTSLTSTGVTPETIDQYEVGYKSAGPRFTLNAAAFYSRYSDIQAATLTITNGIALSNTVNAAKARIYGFEIDGTYELSDALNVRAAFGYTNGKYISFPNAPGYAPDTRPAALPGSYTTVPIDASGNPMVRQPKYQASVQVSYEVPIGDDSLTFTLSPSYSSRVYFDFENQLSQGAVLLLDGSIDFAMTNGVKLSVFGRNITDKVYYRTKGFSTTNISASYGEPAIYGVRLAYAFK